MRARQSPRGYETNASRGIHELKTCSNFLYCPATTGLGPKFNRPVCSGTCSLSLDHASLSQLGRMAFANLMKISQAWGFLSFLPLFWGKKKKKKEKERKKKERKKKERKKKRKKGCVQGKPQTN